MILSVTENPRDIGLSVQGIERIGAALHKRVQKNVFPGAVMVVGRRGRIALHHAVGYRDREAGQTMERDAIFPVASMTKPLTSLAAMMLVEAGDLHLRDSVSAYLPQLDGLRVIDPQGDGVMKTIPLERAPTVLHLMRHTSGFSNGWAGRSALKQIYGAQGLDTPAGQPDDFLTSLASLPLEFQPGTTFCYGVSTDVLGLVVEAVAGRPLDSLVAETITGPLGMTDTGYWVPDPKLHRIAKPQVDPVTGERPEMPLAVERPIFCRGGSTMMSTAMDYARLCQMFLNKGELGGVRLVSRKTVELMTADHLPKGWVFDPDGAAFFTGPPKQGNGAGFGLGFAVQTSLGDAPWLGSVGTFGWAGMSGCTFLVDPQEEMLAVLMMQAPTQMVRNLSLIRALAYQAICD